MEVKNREYLLVSLMNVAMLDDVITELKTSPFKDAMETLENTLRAYLNLTNKLSESLTPEEKEEIGEVLIEVRGLSFGLFEELEDKNAER